MPFCTVLKYVYQISTYYHYEPLNTFIHSYINISDTESDWCGNIISSGYYNSLKFWRISLNIVRSEPFSSNVSWHFETKFQFCHILMTMANAVYVSIVREGT